MEWNGNGMQVAGLLDLALEVLALDEIGYLVVVIVLLALLAFAALLQALVALRQLSQRG